MTEFSAKYLNWFVWFYLAVGGLVGVFLVPPFQKPDEDYHYYQTYALVLGECNFYGNKGSMVIPKESYDLPAKFNFKNVLSGAKFDYQLLNLSYSLTSADFKTLNRPCFKYSWAGYWPQMIGVILGGENLLVSFYLARLMGWVAFLVSVYWALKWSGRYWPIIVAVTILPVTLGQATALSSDALHISLGLLVFSRYVWLKENPLKLNWQTFGSFLGLLLAFNLAKRGYYLSLALPLSLIWTQTGRFKLHLSFMCLAFYLVMSVVINSTVQNLEQITNANFQPEIQQGLIRQQPLEFLNRVWVTTWQKIPEYLANFYAPTTLNPPSWLKVLSLSLTLVTLGGIFLIRSVDVTNKNQRRPETIIIFGIILGSYLMILAAMFIHATATGSPVITGVQGRYLLWPYLLTLYLITRFRP